MIGAITAGLFSGGVAASTNSYESIATTVVGSGGSSSITFSSIPSTFTHLQVRSISRDGTGSGTFDNGGNLTFNGDTGSNYAWHALYGQGSTASATATINTNRVLFITADSGSTANVFTAGVLDILDYTNTNKYTTTRQLMGEDLNGSGGLYFISGLWRNTAAITSITITSTNTYAQYSSFALYGIKG